LAVIRGHVNFELSTSSPPLAGEEWRSMPELPTSQELNPNWEEERATIMALLKKNDITSPYPSKEKYLETHYRLQREEGITMLRFAIKQYRETPGMEDADNTCVYTKVYISTD
jgi:helicase required for RNAi-mediated heterochromatin assembly 1